MRSDERMEIAERQSQRGHRPHASIRAPAWGAISSAGLHPAPNPSFNSRSRVGSDSRRGHAQRSGGVSIRAPAWGAIRGERAFFVWRPVSIRAPAWGAITVSGGIAHASASFNPRSRVGSDAAGTRRVNCPPCFNPRSRVGSDPASRRRDSPTLPVSIRAPAWGAIRGCRPNLWSPAVSIRAPAWGAIGAFGRSHPLKTVSIRAPAWGAMLSGESLQSSEVFQSALPRGERFFWRLFAFG